MSGYRKRRPYERICERVRERERSVWLYAENNAHLQESVRAKADARHRIGGREGGLLGLGKVVDHVAVELQRAHWDERELRVRPDLGGVERERVAIAVRLWHHLDAELPAREVAPLNALAEVAAEVVGVLAGDDLGLLEREACGALLSDPVELDPHALALLVHHAYDGGSESSIKRGEGGRGVTETEMQSKAATIAVSIGRYTCKYWTRKSAGGGS